MKHRLASLLLGLGLSTAPALPAAAYPIDCAILLCLAGGWPASAECALARTVFIRRITPWPIEPPLQIWNCPMRASLEAPRVPSQRYKVATSRTMPQWSVAQRAESLFPAQAVGSGADIDVSGAAFQFIRSIDVFQVHAWQRESGNGENCNGTAIIRHGSYDATGQFTWATGSAADVPSAFQGLERFGSHCPSVWVRSIFVDWTDSAGVYGFEQVNY